ncbi:protein of unknown function [Nakamurella panacisegetis]|uniref:DUF929 domain-containing protein n=1 Tax=Nakamurella panacisegetis TaxID=1090615 RepID=A0A1H0QTK1_9ACTN|nr:DUF929 family protein [Nakamurella panacisegetis]SDP20667.1 protein of unknown function [Nakamurella panacisegetis]
MSNPKGKNPQAGKNRAANQQAAREHARKLREERLRRDRRNRLLRTVGAPVLVVVLIVVVFVVVKANQKPPAAAAPSGPAPATLTASLESIPTANYDTVGKGSTDSRVMTAINGDALTAGGKPRVLYIGAEYCPFCAAERWSMVTALARFGTFSGLGTTSSSSSDSYPNTATLTFHGATYTSQYLSFTGVEETTNVRSGNGYAPLDKPSAADQALVTKYNTSGSIPFVDLGNKYLISGASYDPQVLAGLTQAQIAAALLKPDSDIAKGVLGGANYVTAALCRLTNNQPAAVCTSSAVTSQTLPS